MQSTEELAREKIDRLLTDCGWTVQNRSTINFSAARGIAIREGLLKGGEADYFPSVRLSRLMDELNLPLAA
jgi:type I restriction enzyme R subunit